MGKPIAWWFEKYQADEHLNNVPLKEFDAYHDSFRHSAGRKGISASLSDNVCTMKVIIGRAVKDYLGEE